MKLSSKILIQGLLCLVLAMTANAQGYYGYGSQQRPSTPTPPPPPPATFKQVLIEETEQGSLVKYVKNFPQDLAITKVRLKHNDGDAGFLDNTVELSALPNGGVSKVMVVNAKNLSVGPYVGKKIKFEALEDDGDGWRIYTFATPMYVYRQGTSAACETNIQFYADWKIGKSPEEIARIEEMAQRAAEAAERRAAEAAFPTRTKPVVVKRPKMPYVPKTTEFTTPEEAGYTLLKTATSFNNSAYSAESWKATFAGKCDYYLEGVMTLRHNNGDFVSFKFDGKLPGEKAYFPGIESIGDWRMQGMEQKNDTIKKKLPNGALLVHAGGKSWDFNGSNPRLPNFDFELLYLPNRRDPLEYEVYEERQKEARVLGNRGYRLGNRLYDISNDKKEILVAKAQIVDGIPYPAIASDSIIQAVYTPGCDTLLLKYANGDSLNFKRENEDYLVYSGEIHRNGSALTFKIVNNKQMIVWPNGDKYVGTPEIRLSYLNNPQIKYYTGTLIKNDGTLIQYEGGLTEQEIAAKKKEAARQYEAECKQFGKEYVDAVRANRIIVGMPEALLLKAYECELIFSQGNSKKYIVKREDESSHGYYEGFFTPVVVTNGRVSIIGVW